MTVCVYYTVNYWAIGVGAILSMIIGVVWYGALFGKMWMKINGVDPHNTEEMKAMQKSANSLYIVQFIQKRIKERKSNILDLLENNGIKSMEQYASLMGELNSLHYIQQELSDLLEKQELKND